MCPILMALVFAAAPAGIPPTDRTIVPGERAGPITSKTNAADLARLFGAKRVVAADIDVGAGATSRGAHVMAGTADAIDIIWAPRPGEGIDFVQVVGTSWRLSEGVGVGTPFITLRKVLGNFVFAGWGWDHGGIVDLSETALKRYSGKASIYLKTLASPPPADMVGDKPIFSDDPRLPTMGIEVRTLYVGLVPPRE